MSRGDGCLCSGDVLCTHLRAVCAASILTHSVLITTHSPRPTHIRKESRTGGPHCPGSPAMSERPTRRASLVNYSVLNTAGFAARDAHAPTSEPSPALRPRSKRAASGEEHTSDHVFDPEDLGSPTAPSVYTAPPPQRRPFKRPRLIELGPASSESKPATSHRPPFTRAPTTTPPLGGRQRSQQKKRRRKRAGTLAPSSADARRLESLFAQQGGNTIEYVKQLMNDPFFKNIVANFRSSKVKEPLEAALAGDAAITVLPRLDDHLAASAGSHPALDRCAAHFHRTLLLASQTDAVFVADKDTWEQMAKEDLALAFVREAGDTGPQQSGVQVHRYIVQSCTPHSQAQRAAGAKNSTMRTTNAMSSESSNGGAAGELEGVGEATSSSKRIFNRDRHRLRPRQHIRSLDPTGASVHQTIQAGIDAGVFAVPQRFCISGESCAWESYYGAGDSDSDESGEEEDDDSEYALFKAGVVLPSSPSRPDTSYIPATPEKERAERTNAKETEKLAALQAAMSPRTREKIPTALRKDNDTEATRVNAQMRTTDDPATLDNDELECFEPAVEDILFLKQVLIDTERGRVSCSFFCTYRLAIHAPTPHTEKHWYQWR